MNYPDKIDVFIPKQLFFEDKYESTRDCYLAEALKKLGFNSPIVGELYWARGYGNPNNKSRVIFGSGMGYEILAQYLTKLPYNKHTVMNAFGRGNNILVTLIKVK